MLNPFVILFKKSPTEIVDIRAIPQPKPHTEPTTNTDRIVEYDLWYVLDDIARAADQQNNSNSLPTYPIQTDGGVKKMKILHESDRKELFHPNRSLDKLLRLFERIRPAYYNNMNDLSGAVLTSPRQISPVYDNSNEEGSTAFAKGQPRTDNPYPQDDLKHVSWANGWLRAQQSR
jgi:hypothetical protein